MLDDRIEYPDQNKKGENVCVYTTKREREREKITVCVCVCVYTTERERENNSKYLVFLDKTKLF
jgi:hypothetical protein